MILFPFKKFTERVYFKCFFPLHKTFRNIGSPYMLILKAVKLTVYMTVIGFIDMNYVILKLMFTERMFKIMNKSVILAEKPSVAKDIARVLKCNKKGDGFFENNQYIITWALGHLVTLADPESYDNKYKTWKLEDLPMLPSPLKLMTIKKTSKQFHTIKHLLKRPDVANIIIATDNAREGELVARWIIDKSKVNKHIKRLWISSVTDKAIREGFKNLKPGKQYENLYSAAVPRSEADWYVGLNATRALTTKFNAQLSSGRVQTPTLAMIASREKEIREFKLKKFYGIEAKTRGITIKWKDAKNNQRIFSKERAEKLLNQ